MIASPQGTALRTPFTLYAPYLIFCRVGKVSKDEVSLDKSLTCPPYRLNILFINSL